MKFGKRPNVRGVEIMLKNEVLIVFGEDYGRHPHCLEHLINEILAYNQVIWVETIGMRSPKISWYDFKRIFQILKKWILPREMGAHIETDKNLTVVSPFMLPFNSYRSVRFFNQFMVTRKVKNVLKNMYSHRPIVITSIPSTCDFIKKYEEKISVYLCVDEFSLWPGLPHELIKKMENELLKKTDVIFATSSALANSKRKFGKEVCLLTHGVNVAHFNLKKNNVTDGVERRVCYFGLIDDRCDQMLLAFLANSLPQCIFTIIGEVVASDISILRSCSNIIFEKRVAYNELPSKIANEDIFILPYHVNELTNNINPLKIREYMATGRPVISTPLPEVLLLREFLFVAESATDFVRIISELINGTTHFNPILTLNHLIENESWFMKANLFSDKIMAISLSNEMVM